MTHFQRLIGLSPIVLGMCALLGTEGCRRSGRNDLLPVEGQILDAAGHTTRRWDEANEAEMKIVQRIFAELTTKGYKAFSVHTDTRLKKTVTEPRSTFDPEAQQMLLVPPLAAG